MINWIRVLLWLLPRRLRSSWVLLTMIAFGVLAAVTLMATSSLYSRALAEGGLRHALALASPSGLNSWVIVGNRPLGPADYQRLFSTVEELTHTRLGFMLRDTQRSGQTNIPLTFAPEPEPSDLNTALGRPFFLSDFQQLHANPGRPVARKPGQCLPTEVWRWRRWWDRDQHPPWE